MLNLSGAKGKCSGFHLTCKNKWSSEEWNGGTYHHDKDEQLQCLSSSLTTQTPSSPELHCWAILQAPMATVPIHHPCSSSPWKYAGISLPSTTCPFSSPPGSHLLVCCAVKALQALSDLIFLPSNVYCWTSLWVSKRRDARQVRHPVHSLALL